MDCTQEGGSQLDGFVVPDVSRLDGPASLDGDDDGGSQRSGDSGRQDSGQDGGDEPAPAKRPRSAAPAAG